MRAELAEGIVTASGHANDFGVACRNSSGNVSPKEAAIVFDLFSKVGISV